VPQPSLADLTAAAAKAEEPGFTPESPIRLGGVDPLGLRQINFDLMDEVFPGLNNVARHIRPFVVVAWASRRSAQLARDRGTDRVPVDDLLDFVNRIEVIYAWSQILRKPEAELPGRQFLAHLLRVDRWLFAGPKWKKLCDARRDSTALTAAIAYGPGLKALGWVTPHAKYPRLLFATEDADPALDAFEAVIADRLDHPAFSQFGAVEVKTSDARAWSESWALESPTDAEKRVMANMLLGTRAPPSRRNGCELMIAAVNFTQTTNTGAVRAAMAGAPSAFVPSSGLDATLKAWRRVQVRQLFRLSLEAFFYWVFLEIGAGTRSIETLVNAFLAQTTLRPADGTTAEWLDPTGVIAAAPTALMDRIEEALTAASSDDLASAIADGVAFCLAQPLPQEDDHERTDRLPLSRARREARARLGAPARDFIRHALESWVLAQHAYWSIGRGLADARAHGKTLLRLKVVLDEGGWTHAPGVSNAPIPVPTLDRLQTALNLVQECGLLPVLPTAATEPTAQESRPAARQTG
jgi:hypothetical protein